MPQESYTYGYCQALSGCQNKLQTISLIEPRWQSAPLLERLKRKGSCIVRKCIFPSKHHFSYLVCGLPHLSFLILLFQLTLGLREGAEYKISSWLGRYYSRFIELHSLVMNPRSHKMESQRSHTAMQLTITITKCITRFHFHL